MQGKWKCTSPQKGNGQKGMKKKEEERNHELLRHGHPIDAFHRAVLLLTMTMTMQCHMTTKTFPVPGSGKSHSIKSSSSPSPRNAQGAMHPMIKPKKKSTR